MRWRQPERADTAAPATEPDGFGAVTPAAGTTLGGTTVTVTGTNFAAGATVTIGGAAATDVAVRAQPA